MLRAGAGRVPRPVRADTSPREVQEVIEESIDVPLRYPPHINVEELDDDVVVLRIVTTPKSPRDGARLAEEVLAGVRGTDGGRTETDGNGASGQP